MKIPFVHIFILFIYLVVTNAIPIAPSDSHPLARREQRDHLQILFASENDPSQFINPDTPDRQFKLDIQEIERNYQDKKNLLVPSDATATNQKLHTLSARLDDYVELDEGWYKNSVHVIASGVDLVSQLEKHPSNNLDLNTRILITNFLIFLESAIERMTWELKWHQLEVPPFGPMLGYLQQKLQIFVKSTESHPKARLTFDEMDAELEKVYRGMFKNRYDCQLQIRRVQGVLSKVEKATSMTWEFRMLEVAHVIGQLSQLESANDVLGFYIKDIRKGLEELNKRHVENSTVGVRGTCRPGDDEKLKTYMERLKKKVEHQQQQKLPTAVASSSTSAGQNKRPFEELGLPVDTQLVRRPRKPSVARPE